jgi:SulP family sulfate permease
VLTPKLVTTLKTYDREQFLGDLTAGVIVGIVALPLAIAFAIASGVPPGKGLWTAIVAGFLISALGGSRVQIGGPTGAFVVIVYGIIQQYGIDGLTVATLMAGVMLVAFGFMKLGGVIKFIPHPLITGFTSAIALIIFVGQLKDFFGLQMGDVPADFIEKWVAYAEAAPTVNLYAVFVACLALAIINVWPKINRRIPGSIVALVITTIVVHVFNLPVETIGSRFGEISAAIPTPQVPRISWTDATMLVRPAFTIALLAAVESLLSAVVADGMIGGRHRSNMELVAQGVANIASPMFGGIPATGAIARTATNVKNGGRTPVAGMIHALTLLLITLIFGRWASLIPMATLAAILVVVSYHMSEWRTFLAELRSPKSDVIVLVSTFVLTVLVDLTVAMEVGMVLAAFLFIRRMAQVTQVQAVTQLLDDSAESDESEANAEQRRKVPDGVEIYEINGPFFFGAADTFKETLGSVAKPPKVLILRMRHVPALDSTGIHALKEVVQRFRRDGTVVFLSEVHRQPLAALSGSAEVSGIGRENIFTNLDTALDRARTLLEITQ